jgi:DNA-binding HxlR family transcriptional regulator
MHDKPKGGGHDGAATAADIDTRDQVAVLRHVLDLHPETLTLEELMRELTGISPGFLEEDGIRRAVRDLAAVGLLYHEGVRVFPTRSAVVFHDIYEA